MPAIRIQASLNTEPTTDPAPTTVFVESSVPGKMVELTQSQQPSPIVTSRLMSDAAMCLECGSIVCVPVPMYTLGAISTFAPIMMREEVTMTH